MNKDEENLVLKLFVMLVMQQIVIYPFQAYRAISRMYKKKEKLPAHRRTSLHSLASTCTAI
jgi:hypothetical protein